MIVFKYQLTQTINGWLTVRMPVGAKVLSVDVQNGIVCLWALVDESVSEREMRRFLVVGTGRGFTPTKPISFVGTVLLMNGELVLHVFEEVSS